MGPPDLFKLFISCAEPASKEARARFPSAERFASWRVASRLPVLLFLGMWMGICSSAGDVEVGLMFPLPT